LGKGEAIIGCANSEGDWELPELRELYDRGKVQYVGNYNAMDYELINKLNPDLMLVSYYEVLAELENLGHKVVISYHPMFFSLKHRLNLITFFGGLFNEELKAKALVENILQTFQTIKAKTEGLPPVKVSWGVWFNRKVFAHHGDYWMSELIEIGGGEYVFNYLDNLNNMDLSLEEFLFRSKEAPVVIVNPSEDASLASKAEFVKFHPETSILKAFGPGGRVYGVLSTAYQDTGKLADLAIELASIIHPELYPDTELKYFYPLR
jgi:iron complex transport system substrate-binding protein